MTSFAAKAAKCDNTPPETPPMRGEGQRKTAFKGGIPGSNDAYIKLSHAFIAGRHTRHCCTEIQPEIGPARHDWRKSSRN